MAVIDNLAPRVATLDDVSEAYRIAYLPEDDGSGYWLSPAVAKIVEEGEAELARIRSEGDAKLAELDGEVTTMRGGRVKRAIRSTLIDELQSAGVSLGLATGAAALIESAHELELENDGLGPVVVGRTQYGPRSAQSLVGEFLASDDGREFRPQPNAPEAGMFSAMLSDLKKPR